MRLSTCVSNSSHIYTHIPLPHTWIMLLVHATRKCYCVNRKEGRGPRKYCASIYTLLSYTDICPECFVLFCWSQKQKCKVNADDITLANNKGELWRTIESCGGNFLVPFSPSQCLERQDQGRAGPCLIYIAFNAPNGVFALLVFFFLFLSLSTLSRQEKQGWHHPSKEK